VCMYRVCVYVLMYPNVCAFVWLEKCSLASLSSAVSATSSALIFVINFRVVSVQIVGLLLFCLTLDLLLRPANNCQVSLLLQ